MQRVEGRRRVGDCEPAIAREWGEMKMGMKEEAIVARIEGTDLGRKEQLGVAEA